ncbi:hypothetical protein Pla52n_53620 [Stieleria varia]|uniref:Intein C-terminal splicing domain-containing protein n=1 Tax=Stieleria varia TaxID=2528005 RepID=A0A5C6A648_9BACT|nr:hypothetical protein Pla52n_53620 [Stieleria varia]
MGETITLTLSEMGIEGSAQVLGIEPCPSVSGGNGSLVTGRFLHSSGEVMELRLAGQAEPIGVTAIHPIYSVDRQSYVPAGELFPGETVATLSGETNVAAIHSTGHSQAVFNLEIQGQHVFRVTEDGLLVHNDCGTTSVGSEQTTIIGNGQYSRVVPFAKATGARTIENGMTETDWEKLSSRERYKLNDGNLRERIREGDRFRSLGPDGRNRKLDLLIAEMNRLRERGIPVEEVPQDEILNVIGR